MTTYETMMREDEKNRDHIASPIGIFCAARFIFSMRKSCCDAAKWFRYLACNIPTRPSSMATQFISAKNVTLDQ